ncbi:hypothetical protein [Paenibacillus sp. GCM10012306]|uniref:hypothetical protein n=1 Tax=Paenibacillus sp. GCM10012306 TaxID=3317342 RepID=UPI0036107D1E
MPTNSNGNSSNNSGGEGVEANELSAEDYAIIGAGLTALGDFFAFLSLVKAKEITKETGGQTGVTPLAIIRSYEKVLSRKKNQPRRRR